MKYQINSILPDEISDEAAFCLVNFVSELSLFLEEKYFAQLRRYYQEQKIAEMAKLLPVKENVF